MLNHLRVSRESSCLSALKTFLHDAARVLGTVGGPLRGFIVSPLRCGGYLRSEILVGHELDMRAVGAGLRAGRQGHDIGFVWRAGVAGSVPKRFYRGCGTDGAGACVPLGGEQRVRPGRRELRHDFGTRGMQVAVQDELSHLTGASTLLGLLDTHMRDCAGAVFGLLTVT